MAVTPPPVVWLLGLAPAQQGSPGRWAFPSRCPQAATVGRAAAHWSAVLRERALSEGLPVSCGTERGMGTFVGLGAPRSPAELPQLGATPASCDPAGSKALGTGQSSPGRGDPQLADLADSSGPSRATGGPVATGGRSGASLSSASLWSLGLASWLQCGCCCGSPLMWRPEEGPRLHLPQDTELSAEAAADAAVALPPLLAQPGGSCGPALCTLAGVLGWPRHAGPGRHVGRA